MIKRKKMNKLFILKSQWAERMQNQKRIKS